jgi:hypothetical protein
MNFETGAEIFIISTFCIDPDSFNTGGINTSEANIPAALLSLRFNQGRNDQESLEWLFPALWIVKKIIP